MIEKVERPDCVEDGHLMFLDLLQGARVTNMFEAAPYLVENCGVSKKDSHVIVGYWIESYDEREHPAAEHGGNC